MTSDRPSTSSRLLQCRSASTFSHLLPPYLACSPTFSSQVPLGIQPNFDGYTALHAATEKGGVLRAMQLLQAAILDRRIVLTETAVVCISHWMCSAAPRYAREDSFRTATSPHHTSPRALSLSAATSACHSLSLGRRSSPRLAVTSATFSSSSSGYRCRPSLASSRALTSR